MLYKATALLAVICCPTLIFAQMPYKNLIIYNGFEEGKLVRKHIMLYYNHLNMKLAGDSKLTDGFITVDHVVEYVMNDSFGDYATYIYKDTLLAFYGVTVKSKKMALFSRFLQKIFFIYMLTGMM